MPNSSHSDSLAQQRMAQQESAQDMAELSFSAGIACLSRNELTVTALPLWVELLGGHFIAGAVFAETTRLAYHNTDWIAALDAHILNFLKKVNLKKINKKNPQDITQEDLKKACLASLKSEITKDVAYSGLLQSLSMASLVFSVGQIFPPAFAVTTLLSLGIVVAGSITTTWMLYKFRKQVEKNCKEFFEDQKNHTLLTDTIERLKLMKNEEKKRSLFESILHFFTKTLPAISYGAQIVRILQGSLSFLKNVAPIFNLAATGVRAVVEPISNYWTRQSYLLLQNKASFKDKAVNENIFEKKYIFFGKTKLDLFRADQKSKGITFHNDTEEYKACQEHYQQKAFKAFQKKQKGQVSKKDFEISRIRRFVKKDVMVSGFVNTFYVASFFAGLAMLIPPLFIPGLVVAAITAVVGCITTMVVAKKEANKFENAFSERSENKETPAMSEHQNPPPPPDLPPKQTSTFSSRVNTTRLPRGPH